MVGMLVTLLSQEGTTLQGVQFEKIRYMNVIQQLSLSLTHTHTQAMIKLIQKLKRIGQVYEMLPVKVGNAPFQKFKVTVS
jgi:hypothetical protein